MFEKVSHNTRHGFMTNYNAYDESAREAGLRERKVGGGMQRIRSATSNGETDKVGKLPKNKGKNKFSCLLLATLRFKCQFSHSFTCQFIRLFVC